MDVVAVYPGRFHPFHKGHAASFNELENLFGKNNVYLAISQKQEMPDSPFSPGERAQMAVALGIPKANIISVSNTYGRDEYVNKFNAAGKDPNKTALVLAVSGKDADRFSFKPKKDGSPAYIQPYKEGSNLEPMTKHAYVKVTDVADFDLGGNTIRDASSIRKMYAGAHENGRLSLLAQLYGDKAAKILKPTFDERLAKVAEVKGGQITGLIQRARPVIEHYGTKEQIERFNKLVEALIPKQTLESKSLDYLPEK